MNTRQPRSVALFGALASLFPSSGISVDPLDAPANRSRAWRSRYVPHVGKKQQRKAGLRAAKACGINYSLTATFSL